VAADKTVAAADKPEMVVAKTDGDNTDSSFGSQTSDLYTGNDICVHT
tara:strand:- start:429 stop:569 length:141 start_codon:yes stop_codon:yes gene_type:complete